MARYRLARAGYAVGFEFASGRLWCPSCDVSVAPECCSVDASIVVGRVEGRPLRLAAIRSDSPVLLGTWLVGSGEEEGRFLEDLVRRGLERATARTGVQGSRRDGDAPRVPAQRAPHASTGRGDTGRRARLLTVTW